VDVVVEGARSDVMALQADQVTATADLFGMSKGQNYLVVSVSVPEKLTVTEIRTNRIPVLIDELVSLQKPVVIQVLDETAGYELGSLSIQPTEISVTGAKSIVDQVRSVRIQISQETLGETPSTLQLSAVAVDAEGGLIHNIRLSNAYVELTAARYQTKTVPLEVPLSGTPAPNMEIIEQDVPREITIRGSAKSLETVDAIAAEPLSIQGLAQDTTLAVVPILPPEVEIAEASAQLEAAFDLAEVAEVQFSYAPGEVWVENVPAGYRLEVISGGITVTARGEEAVVNVLKSADLQPAIDASLLEPGSQEAALTTRYKQQLVRVSLSPAVVRIRLRISEEPSDQ
jgi:YbbR domain-containing protein